MALCYMPRVGEAHILLRHQGSDSQ
uniref:Uncharacterized protein n=1 Tax=Physcomitrium patens TaxID=3218 RepID=A0A2K1J187_PHYPA|nr:hypothetical protein PHYPA_023189 [Physcomitrium patens]